MNNAKNGDPGRTGHLIVIADDDTWQRLLIRETLTSDPSLTFMEAADGQQTLDLIQEYHPDLIILDIQMPKLDGLQLCRLLKAHPLLKQIPVILVSGSEDKQAGWAAGCDAYLSKPFKTAELEATVQGFLRPTDEE
jgi:CheY-like chemotaxis protein